MTSPHRYKIVFGARGAYFPHRHFILCSCSTNVLYSFYTYQRTYSVYTYACLRRHRTLFLEEKKSILL